VAVGRVAVRGEGRMGEGLTFTKGVAAAGGYERAFAHVSSHFVPFLLRASRPASDSFRRRTNLSLSSKKERPSRDHRQG
jgi:hypothetical protein